MPAVSSTTPRSQERKDAYDCQVKRHPGYYDMETRKARSREIGINYYSQAKGGLNKSINDAGWGLFQQFCLYKAEEAGRTVLVVNPRYSSQVCSGCGAVVRKELSERWHSCECGCSLDRDHNAALNILALGRSVQGTRP